MKILFYPDALRYQNKLRYLLEYLGIEWTNDIVDDWDKAIFWDFNTTRTLPLELIGCNAINEKCITADKLHVENVFYKIFGYNSLVDPTTHKGRCIRKSIYQAKHDGIIVDCPRSKESEDIIFQKFIDTRISDGFIQEIRVPFIKDTIPFIFEKIRPVFELFGSQNRRNYKIFYHKNPQVFFTKEEIILLKEFCLQFPVEYCELDVLRSNFDGKIYILDMNNTPSGGLFISMGVENEETKEAIKDYAEAFYEKLLK